MLEKKSFRRRHYDSVAARTASPRWPLAQAMIALGGHQMGNQAGLFVELGVTCTHLTAIFTEHPCMRFSKSLSRLTRRLSTPPHMQMVEATSSTSYRPYPSNLALPRVLSHT